jgi:hypothetical protein
MSRVDQYHTYITHGYKNLPIPLPTGIQFYRNSEFTLGISMHNSSQLARRHHIIAEFSYSLMAHCQPARHTPICCWPTGEERNGSRREDGGWSVAGNSMPYDNNVREISITRGCICQIKTVVWFEYTPVFIHYLWYEYDMCTNNAHMIKKYAHTPPIYAGHRDEFTRHTSIGWAYPLFSARNVASTIVNS